MRAGVYASLGVSVLSLGACADAVAPPVHVGGIAAGLGGKELVLRMGEQELAVTGDGAFQFASPIEPGAPYEVRLATVPVPSDDPCAVANGSGIAGTTDVLDLAVTCPLAFTVGGLVRGLEGKDFSLLLNGGSALAIAADGAFAFESLVPAGAKYAVSVAGHPSQPTQSCYVARAQGLMGTEEVTDILIDCATERFKVGGTVTGLADKLVLRNHAGELLQVAEDGAFLFDTGVQSGAGYAVWVEDQPKDPAQTCVVTGGSGTVGASEVKDIQVDCAEGAPARRDTDR